MVLQLPGRRPLRKTPLQRPESPADDASTSSTFLAVQVVKHAAPLQKQVRFCLADNAEHSNEDMYREDLGPLWYSASDYKSFRNKARYLAKEITRTERANQAPFSYSRVLTRTYQACCEKVACENKTKVLTPDEQKHLVRWAQVATSRLGLEKWSVPAVLEDKNYRRSILTELVLQIQNLHDALPDNALSKEESIRQASERVTRPSMLFARTLAEAQAAAGMATSNQWVHVVS